MVIFGFSNLVSELFDCLQANGRKTTRLVVNVPGQKPAAASELSEKLRGLNEWPLITALEDFSPEEAEDYFILPDIPKAWVLADFLKKAHDLRFSRLVHPKAHVSPLARLGQGVFIGAGCIIGPGVVLKDHVFVKAGVVVGQDAVLHEYARLNLRCTVGSRVQVRAGATVGPGANLVDDVAIGRGAVVAPGAVVVKNVRDRDPLSEPVRRLAEVRLNRQPQPRPY